jgi:hypothetical protein
VAASGGDRPAHRPLPAATRGDGGPTCSTPRCAWRPT